MKSSIVQQVLGHLSMPELVARTPAPQLQRREVLACARQVAYAFVDEGRRASVAIGKEHLWRRGFNVAMAGIGLRPQAAPRSLQAEGLSIATKSYLAAHQAYLQTPSCPSTEVLAHGLARAALRLSPAFSSTPPQVSRPGTPTGSAAQPSGSQPLPEQQRQPRGVLVERLPSARPGVACAPPPAPPAGRLAGLLGWLRRLAG